MMRRVLVSIFIVLIAVPALFAQAQDVTTIDVGQTVTGEITNRAFEIPFDFTGTQDQVIMFLMVPVDNLGDLTRPDIIVIDAEGDVVADTSDIATYGYALLVLQLQEAGQYTVLATRGDGRAGDSVGEFLLQMIQPQEISLNTPVTATASSEAGTTYYLVNSDGSPLSIEYRKTDGDFNPAIEISRINDEWGLDTTAQLQGEELEYGAINVPDDAGVYIIAVGEALFDFNYQEVTAEYQLVLEPIE